MSTLATGKGQTFAEQIRAANHRVQSNFSTKKRLTKKDLDAIKNCFLDYYEIYMHAKRSVPKPELLDESGLLVEILEDCETAFSVSPHVTRYPDCGVEPELDRGSPRTSVAHHDQLTGSLTSQTRMTKSIPMLTNLWRHWIKE